ncbi:MAG TPA: S9 family peptidase [Vicinamibacterales bacterium]|nr:S9 family peptidase [Vicinamibacterales bacterium]
MKHTVVIAALAAVLFASPAAAQKRALAADDIYSLKEVRDPQRSPDGKWVAYVVSRAIKDTDKNDTDIWMASWDGTQEIQLTSSPDGESRPRWSPDNKYLSFISSRQGAKHGQLWLMNRAGGEAIKVTDVKGGIADYEWAPDATRLVFVVNEPDPRDPKEDEKADPEKKKTPPPIVIDRYQFKQDVEGYLRNARSHLYVFDLAAKKAEALTSGTRFDESSPAWSPDGTKIAFVSKRGDGDLDRHDNTDVWVIDARPGAQPRQITTTPVSDEGPLSWSPDGRQIAFVVGEELKYSAYSQNRLAVVPSAGGQPRYFAESLDRPIRQPVWEEGGSSLAFVVVDDRTQYPARVTLATGKVERLVTGKSVIANLSAGRPDGSYAVLVSTATEPAEVAAFEPAAAQARGAAGSAQGNGTLRRLSHQNDAWLKNVLLGTTEEFTSISKDGTEVHGLLVKPPTFNASQKYPTLLRIHGGPNGQDEHAFSFEREFFAANGYVVVAVNYRGSNGRGSAFQKAIYADWGGKEVVDLLGAMDHVQKLPYVDAARLGIGGWSYGGILTDYTIATDGRFKAATSGAGSALQLSMYGVDQYITQYEQEIGPPWKSPDLWIKISYPFFHADRIKTPTLFMVGEKDFNVPAAGSEQMYQALKSLGVDTQLVIYPAQFHGITVPTYKVDRLQRYLDWYDKYLKPSKPSTTASGR